jgi:hypothetical protein
VRYDSFNIESLALITFGALGIFALMGGMVYKEQRDHDCVMTAMKMEKSADDIKKICHGK